MPFEAVLGSLAQRNNLEGLRLLQGKGKILCERAIALEQM